MVQTSVAAAHALDKRVKKHFCDGGWYPEVFEFVTAIHRIAIPEADVTDGELPKVHRLGSDVVDC